MYHSRDLLCQVLWNCSASLEKHKVPDFFSFATVAPTRAYLITTELYYLCLYQTFSKGRCFKVLCAGTVLYK